MENKKICPVCETPNFLGAKNCEVCGEPLPIPQTESGAGDPGESPDTAPEPSAEGDASAAASTDESLRELERFDSLLGESGAEAAGFVRDHDTIVDRKLPSHEPQSEVQPTDSTGFTEPTETAMSQGPAATHPSSSPDIAAPEGQATSAPSEAAEPATPAPQAAEPVAEAGAEDASRDTSPDVACARLTVYVNKEAVDHFDIAQDETLIGRADPTSDAWPDFDLTRFDDDQEISRKHAYIYREAGDYFIYPISNSGTQLGSELLDIGEKTQLSDGDVIILAGTLAMKFELP